MEWRDSRAHFPGGVLVIGTLAMDDKNPAPVLVEPDRTIRGRRPGLAFAICDGRVERDHLRRQLACRRLEGALGAARARRPPPGVDRDISVAPGELVVEIRAWVTDRATTLSFRKQLSPFEVQVALQGAAMAVIGEAA
jgi:hypothetical protein